VASKTAQEHHEHLRRLFERLQQFGVNNTKCVFGVSKISFLGHLISGKGLALLLQKVEAIVNFPEPQDVKSLRRFLGIINFYHRFLLNIANTQEVIKDQKKNSQILVD